MMRHLETAGNCKWSLQIFRRACDGAKETLMHLAPLFETGMSYRVGMDIVKHWPPFKFKQREGFEMAAAVLLSVFTEKAPACAVHQEMHPIHAVKQIHIENKSSAV